MPDGSMADDGKAPPAEIEVVSDADRREMEKLLASFDRRLTEAELRADIMLARLGLR